MLKKFFALTTFLLIFSANCSAMTFQQPVEVGNVSISGANSIQIDGTTNIDATRGDQPNSYIKGVAIFNEKLYLHFDGEILTQKSFFGGRDVKNSVEVFVFEGLTKIYQIDNDAGLEMYLLSTETGGGGSMKVIGTTADGKWVKYFDTNDAKKNYELSQDFYLKNFSVSGDSITFQYEQWQTRKICTLRYRWDNKAQWFGIDVIK